MVIVVNHIPGDRVKLDKLSVSVHCCGILALGRVAASTYIFVMSVRAMVMTVVGGCTNWSSCIVGNHSVHG